MAPEEKTRPDTFNGTRENATDNGAVRASAEDLALVERLRGGDKVAFSELVKTHYGPMKRLALGFVADPATAEEMVQDTWMAVLQGIESFEGRSSLKSWIFGILVNKSKTRGVRDKRMVAFSNFGDGDDERSSAIDPSRFNKKGMWKDPPEPWGESGPERHLQQEETREVLLAAIACLEPKQRMVVTLRDMEAMGSKEVCNILGISDTYERVLLHRARSALRGRLESFMKER